jgi:hypothetical protein
MVREYKNLKALRNGEVVELGGLKFVMDEGEIGPGDVYIGERNTVNVYVCREVNIELGCVVPMGIGYPFDIGECVKVKEVH